MKLITITLTLYIILNVNRILGLEKPNCAICLEEFTTGRTIQLHPTLTTDDAHIFHIKCLQGWYNNKSLNRLTCISCLKPLDMQEQEKIFTPKQEKLITRIMKKTPKINRYTLFLPFVYSVSFILVLSKSLKLSS